MGQQKPSHKAAKPSKMGTITKLTVEEPPRRSSETEMNRSEAVISVGKLPPRAAIDVPKQTVRAVIPLQLRTKGDSWSGMCSEAVLVVRQQNMLFKINSEKMAVIKELKLEQEYKFGSICAVWNNKYYEFLV